MTMSTNDKTPYLRYLAWGLGLLLLPLLLQSMGLSLIHI